MISQEKLLALQKLQKEFKDIQENPLTNIRSSIDLFNENDFFTWRCKMKGPIDTPYENGLFYLKIKFPDNYPKKPPEITFINPIYHININPYIPTDDKQDPIGHICLSTLNWWNEKNDIRQVLTNIFVLLSKANEESPYNLSRADEMINNKELFDKKVLFFIDKYATQDANEPQEWSIDWDFRYP